MGRDVPALVFTREDRRRYRIKMQKCLDAFAQMLRTSRFESERPQVGLEIELNLADDRAEPAMRNLDVLEAIADPAWSTELGRFNLEINIPPRRLTAGGPDAWEAEIRAALNHAEDRAAATGAHLIMIGILPTLRQEDVGEGAVGESALSPAQRPGVRRPRGGPAHRHRRHRPAAHLGGHHHAGGRVHQHPVPSAGLPGGVRRLLERGAGDRRGAGGAGGQLAVPVRQGAVGRDPHPAVRAGHRHPAAGDQGAGVRPRVWFGERWINSVFDLFEENLRYFPALLPLCDDEDPEKTLDSGDIPQLGELTLHNGTIYRWNRPVYAVAQDKPHLRVENRVLPAGPTVADTLANGAFYYGLTRALVEEERPVWSRMSFQAAEDNLHTAARHGIDAQLYWPGVGEVPVQELVLRRLLPLAHRGLERSGMDAAWREPLLGVIEQRCVTGRNGAVWQKEMFHHLDSATRASRHEVLRRTTELYVEYMHLNAPVHTWPVD